MAHGRYRRRDRRETVDGKTRHCPASIKLFGSPAEEMLVSRPYMVRAGLFKDVDVVINNHAGSQFETGYGVRAALCTPSSIHSKGRPPTVRAALGADAAPWTLLKS